MGCPWHMPGSPAGSLLAGAAVSMLGCVPRCRPGEPCVPCSPRCPPLAAGARLGLAPARMAQGWLPPKTSEHLTQGPGFPPWVSVCGQCISPSPAAVPVLVTPQGMGPLAEASGCSPCWESLAPARGMSGRLWSPARPEWLLPLSPSCSSESIPRTRPQTAPATALGSGMLASHQHGASPLLPVQPLLNPTCHSLLPSRQRRCEP